VATDAVSSWEILDLTRGPDAKFSVVLYGFARAVQPNSLIVSSIFPTTVSFYIFSSSPVIPLFDAEYLSALLNKASTKK
jgi:hypothetical protein